MNRHFTTESRRTLRIVGNELTGPTSCSVNTGMLKFLCYRRQFSAPCSPCLRGKTNPVC